MDTFSMSLSLGYTAICVAAVFLLREKYPLRFPIGIVLCFFAPAWGQIYVKSKHNWMPWMMFMTIERAFSSAETISTATWMLVWLFLWGSSGLTMYFRITSAKERAIYEPCEESMGR